jgi:simple sugar transport system permease protein
MDGKLLSGKRRYMAADRSILQLLLIAIVVFIIMALLNSGKFLTLLNIESMAYQFPELGIISLGMMIAMLSGGIDLSIVSIANMASILMGLILTKMMPQNAASNQIMLFVAFALLISLLTGLISGLINGFLIAHVGIPAILATLGTSQILTGIAIVITKGYAVPGFPEIFLKIGNSKLFIFPIPFLVFLACAIVLFFLLQKSSFGIKVKSILMKSYALTGVLASIAGIVMTARTNSAKADYGSSYVLQAVLVAVLGGVNPAGGFGSVIGLSIAVLSLQFLSSGFNMLRFSNFATEFTWGMFLLLIMGINYFQNKRIKSSK